MIGITQSEYDEYKSRNNQSVRWLKARIYFPDRGGISVESEDELMQFFKRRQPDGQWKIASRKCGIGKQVPNLSDKSTAVWRRLEAERSKSRSMEVQKGGTPSYGRRGDWWPILEGFSEEERRRRANEWIEQGGWNDLEREYGVGDTSEEEEEEDDDDWNTDGDKYLERDHPVAKMEEAVPVTIDELASFELIEEQEAGQQEQREEEKVEQEEEQELELEEAVPVTVEELASFELREEKEEELEAERDDELEEGSVEGKVQRRETISVSNDELD